MYAVSNPEVFFTRLVLDESHGTIINGLCFGRFQKSAICIESVVQIVTVIHMILTNFDARAYLGLNPAQPVIGT